MNLQDNQSTLVGGFVVWGSPVTYRLSADIYQFAPTGKQAQEQTVYEAYFDEPLEIRVPKAKGNSAVVYFSTYNKDNDYLMIGNNRSLLQLEKQVSTDDYDTYIYRIVRPA